MGISFLPLNSGSILVWGGVRETIEGNLSFYFGGLREVVSHLAGLRTYCWLCAKWSFLMGS